MTQANGEGKGAISAHVPGRGGSFRRRVEEASRKAAEAGRKTDERGFFQVKRGEYKVDPKLGVEVSLSKGGVQTGHGYRARRFLAKLREAKAPLAAPVSAGSAGASAALNELITD